MKKLAFLIAIALLSLVLGFSSPLNAQLNYELTIDSVSSYMIMAHLSITNTSTVPYSTEMGMSPWCGLMIDGVVQVFGGLTIVIPIYIAPGETIVENISCFVVLSPGVYSIQAVIDPPNYTPVGNVVILPYGFDPPEAINCQLLVDTADQNGLEMRLKITNTSATEWSYSFPYDPFIRYSINGQMADFVALPAITPLTIPAYESRYFPILHYETMNQGVYTVQAYLILDGFLDPWPVGAPVEVVIDQMMTHTIGSGELQDRIPVDYYWRNSLYECIYTLQDLEGAAGYINAIGFYGDFGDIMGPHESACRIYLGSTTQADLAEGWIPASQLTLVYQGSPFLIDGQTLYQYILLQDFPLPVNRNLVLLYERTFPSSYWVENLKFLSQECPIPNARKSWSDSTDLDPFNPPAPSELQLVGRMPKTTLFYLPATLAEDDPSSPPPELNLRNYPNPFNPETTISFSLPSQASVCLKIYDLKGRLIKVLVDEDMDRGEHQAFWNGTDFQGRAVASGVYYYRLQAGNRSCNRKMVLMK